MLRRETRYFCQALSFYTRIPCDVDMTDFRLNSSHHYLSAVGWVVGAWAALVFVIAHHFVNPTLAILLSISSTVLLTGALHEDGWADVCDGFGGGWEQAQILHIMKDSRLGSYGVLGLLLLLLVKFYLLSAVSLLLLPWVLLAGHVVSRFSLCWPLHHADYVAHEHSKINDMGEKMSLSQIGFAALALLPLFYCLPTLRFALGVGFALLSAMVFTRYVNQRLGGYTGDCLGAMQQLAEVGFYVAFVLQMKS